MFSASSLMKSLRGIARFWRSSCPVSNVTLLSLNVFVDSVVEKEIGGIKLIDC